MTLQLKQLAEQNEVEEFGCIQKNEYGFDLLDTRLKRTMRSKFNVDPNMWILNEGTKTFLTNVRRENFTFFLAGAGGEQVFKSGLNGQASKAIDVKNDCMIFEAKSVEIPEIPEPVNLLLRNRVIGEFYPMFQHTDVDETYNSSHRAITIYDAQKDGFTKISLEDALAACPRFHYEDRGSDGALNFEDVTPDDCDGDPFLYDTDTTAKAVVQYFGDMRKDALPEQALRDFVKSALNAFDPTRHENLRHALDDGLRLIEEIEDISLSAPEAQKEYFEWMGKVYGVRSPQTPLFTIDPATELVDLPKYVDVHNGWNDNKGDNPLFVPCGYSTFAGLSVLAKLSNAQYYGRYQARAAAFVRAVTDVHARAALVCRGNFFCDPAYQPGYLPKPDGRNTLVANVITMPQPPIVLILNVSSNPTNWNVELEPGMMQIFITIKNERRVKHYLDAAFEGDLLKIDYDAVLLTGEDVGVRLAKFEAAICMALTHATATEDGRIAEFTPNQDGVFQAGNVRSSEEDIELCRDLAATLINALRRVGLDSGDEPIRHLAYKVVMLMLAMRFNPDKPMATTNIFGLVYGLSYARGPETMKKYLEAANNAYAAWLGGASTVKKALLDELVNEKLLKRQEDDLSRMIQVENDGMGRKALVGETHRVLPLAGSQAMLVYFQNNAGLQNKFTVANNGQHQIFKDAKEAYVATGDDAWFKSRSSRYTHAAFDLNNSTAAARHAGAGFDRETAVLPQYEDMPPTIKGGVLGKRGAVHYSRSEELLHDKRQRADPTRPNEAGWSLGFGSSGGPGGSRQQARGEHFTEGMPGAFSYNFAERYRKHVNNDFDVVARCMGASFLSTVVNRHNLQNFIRNNVVFPFDVLLFRPNMEFRMSTGVLAKAGRETGETLIGQSNFILGDNPVNKTHYGNYTINMRSFVRVDRNVHLQMDMGFDRYIRGMDCSFVRSRADHDAFVLDTGGGKSLYVALEPYGGAEKAMLQNPIDISGRRASNVPQNTGFAGRDHYATAAWMRAYYGLSSDDVNDPNGLAFYQASPGNTVAYRGHTGLYNAGTRQHDLVMPNTGAQLRCAQVLWARFVAF